MREKNGNPFHPTMMMIAMNARLGALSHRMWWFTPGMNAANRFRMPKFGSSMIANVRTTGMSGTAQGIARMARTNPRPGKLQFISMATASPSVIHTAVMANVNSNVVRTDDQKTGSCHI